MDFALAIAVEQVASERCQSCGGPKHLCSNDDGDLDFSTEEHTCFVSRAREKRQEATSGKDGKGDTTGKYYSAEPFSKSGAPLGSFRGPYWEAQSKRREEILKSRPGYAEPELVD